MNKFSKTFSKGETPLDPNEIEGLIPDYITTQEELNNLEQQNIIEAMNWIDSQKNINVLNITFNFELHKKMFGQVWRWADKLRRTDKNIGVPWQQITTKLGDLFEDTQYWINNKIYKWDELGARFHHKLVFIHPFSNGNGRHGRLMTDTLLRLHNQQIFTWGTKTNPSSIRTESKTRESYLLALKKADNKNFDDLINFVKS